MYKWSTKCEIELASLVNHAFNHNFYAVSFIMISEKHNCQAQN